MDRCQFIHTASVASALPGLAIVRTNNDPLAGFPTIPDFNRYPDHKNVVYFTLNRYKRKGGCSSTAGYGNGN